MARAADMSGMSCPLVRRPAVAAGIGVVAVALVFSGLLVVGPPVPSRG
ncbi:hypothetical protein [Curtobacterium sp. csp3]|nr:hypothetical protein [Curtobacterium sp. csp3]QKS12912.1 hypothetical protein HUN60_07020 [Curtobacterium sp. csp3]